MVVTTLLNIFEGCFDCMNMEYFDYVIYIFDDDYCNLKDFETCLMIFFFSILDESEGAGFTAFLITAISIFLIIITVPFSLCLCVKVSILFVWINIKWFVKTTILWIELFLFRLWYNEGLEIYTFSKISIKDNCFNILSLKIFSLDFLLSYKKA